MAKAVRTLVALSALAGWMLLASPAAAAVGDASACGDAPPAEWLSIPAVATIATELGYRVFAVQHDDGCYVVDGLDVEGRRVEVEFNPATGEAVRTKYAD